MSFLGFQDETPIINILSGAYLALACSRTEPGRSAILSRAGMVGVQIAFLPGVRPLQGVRGALPTGVRGVLGVWSKSQYCADWTSVNKVKLPN